MAAQPSVATVRDAAPDAQRGGWADAGPPIPMDPWLFFATIALASLGLVTVYSAGAWIGHTEHANWEYFLVRHGTFAAIGIAWLLLVSRMDYRVLRRFSGHFMIVAFVLLVAVLFTEEVNGARRWLRFGPINVQPSEFAKVVLTVFLAANLAQQGERVRRFKAGFLPIMAVAGITMMLVLLEKDLGTTILLGALTLIMLFVAGTRLVYVTAALMIALPVVWQLIVGVEYRRARLESFLSNEGYQVNQALISIGSGGPWGLGLGNGRQKLGFLPENHTDFILATIGEELGLFGILLVIGLVTLLVWRGLRVGWDAPDRFGTYLAVGLSALFGLQALVNMAVVLDVVPAKGITLPFLSYGGSSLLMSMTAAGLLLSISRRPRAWLISDQRGQRRTPVLRRLPRPGPRSNSRFASAMRS